MVFCREKMRWFVVVIDANDTTCILDRTVGGFVFEGFDGTERGWIFGDAGTSLQWREESVFGGQAWVSDDVSRGVVAEGDNPMSERCFKGLEM